MAYIGNTPAEFYQTLEKQSFTTSATTSYTLNFPVTNPQEIALFINNIRQNPNSSYTVSNLTTLTLSSATSSSDVMYAVFLGKSVGTVAPALNSVTTGMLVDDAVTSEKLAAGAGGVAGITSSADTTAMTIDSSENVGIGTSSPTSRLEISDSSSTKFNIRNSSLDNNGEIVSFQWDNNADFTIQGRDSTGGFKANWYTITSTATDGLADEHIWYTGSSAERMRIASDGKVGIGTSSPSAELEIASSSTQIRLTDTDTNVYAEIGTDGSGILNFMADEGNTGASPRITFDVSTTERMRIDSSGNVGIGTSSPTSQLHINSTASGNTLHTLLKLETDGTNDGSGITIDTRTAHTRGEINFLDGTGSYDSNYVFKTATGSQLAAPTEKFRVTPTGATVTGNLTNSGDMFIGTTSATNSAKITNLFSRISHIGMVSENDGGNFSTEHIRFKNTGTTRGSIVVDQSSTTYNTTSDYRLKENVNYDWIATERLKQLKPAQFNFISDTNNTLQDGFLAHEVSSVVPQAVFRDKDEVDDDGTINPQQLDHSKLVPLLVKTIQELEARITELENA